MKIKKKFEPMAKEQNHGNTQSDKTVECVMGHERNHEKDSIKHNQVNPGVIF